MPGESTVEQLEEVIIPGLEKLLKMDYNNLPPVEDRYLISLAYALKVWEWSMKNASTLYLLIVKYENFMKDKTKKLFYDVIENYFK